MAFISFEFCSKCQKQTQHVNRDCIPCKVTKKEKIEEENLKKFTDLTTDEKLIFLFKKLEKIEIDLNKIKGFASINKPLY